MAAHAQSGTLTPDTVATVTITDAYPDGIEIINRSQAGTIWVRLDNVNPTVAGADCHPIIGSRRFAATTIGQETVVVKMISSEGIDYTVEGTVATQ